jgi:hypothetical protein
MYLGVRRNSLEYLARPDSSEGVECEAPVAPDRLPRVALESWDVTLQLSNPDAEVLTIAADGCEKVPQHRQRGSVVAPDEGLDRTQHPHFGLSLAIPRANRGGIDVAENAHDRKRGTGITQPEHSNSQL